MKNKFILTFFFIIACALIVSLIYIKNAPSYYATKCNKEDVQSCIKACDLNGGKSCGVLGEI